MARTYEANVILGLKEQLSKGLPKSAAAINAFSSSLDKAERQAREFATAAGKMPAWGGAFQKQVDRLRLSVAETERLKASWIALNKEIGANGNKGFQTVAQTRWRNEALASILAVREAQRQLSADAIKETRAQVAAEKRLLAEGAREKARLAREAARAAVQAAREAARADRTAQQESVKAAREAAREKGQIARAAAAEAKRLERDAARARREALREEAAHRRRIVGWGSDTVRNLGYAVGIGGGTYLAGRGIRATAVSSAELQREKARDYLAGLSPEDTAKLQAKAFQTSAMVRSVDAATMHSLLRETSLTTLGLNGAMQLGPDLARSIAVVSSMKSPGEALTALTRLLRGLDTLGKNVDVGVIQSLLDGFTRAQGVEGAEFSVGDVYTFAKRSKAGGLNLNERFLTRILPGLISDMSPDRAGTAMGSTLSQIIAGRGTKASKALQARYGLRDKKGRVIGGDDLMQDPFAYTMNTLVPALQRKGVDTNDGTAVASIISNLFSNQMVSDIFTRMILQSQELLTKEQKINRAPGLAAGQQISEKDPFVAAAGAIDQLKNAVGALMEPINPAAIAGLNGVADVMARTAAWLKENEMAGTVLGAGAAAGGTAAGVYGAYKVYNLLSGGFGLATSAAALNGSAAALTAAAAKLGGAGVAADLPGAKPSPGKGAASIGLIGTIGAAAYGEDLAAKAVELLTGNTPEQQAKKRAAATARGWEDIKDAAASVFASPDAQSAGDGIGSDLIAGLKRREPEVAAAAMSIMDRVRAVLGVGVDIPVRVNGQTYPGSGLNRAGARGAGSLGIDSAGRATGPGRSSGGHVVAGGLYQINELGQEWFVPDESGTVIPHGRMAGSGGSQPAVPAARGQVSIGDLHFHISGAQSPKMTAEEITRELRGVFADYGLDFA